MFNDFICGIILLFECIVELGDIVDMNGLVGMVKKIGIRILLVEMCDFVLVIVFNLKLVVDNVINWSYFDFKVCFKVSVGVVYGFDIVLVKEILLEVVNVYFNIVWWLQLFVCFVNFGDFFFDFEIFFWLCNFIVIEDVKSDFCFEIDCCFWEENIFILFLQCDIWIKKENLLFSEE